MIFKNITHLNSFSRCECDYNLLEVGPDLYAIEWDRWPQESPYAILYTNLFDATKDFDLLARKQIGYDAIAERTDPENIMHTCPWNDGPEALRIESIDGEFWNVFDPDKPTQIKVGPYTSLFEAVANIETDYYAHVEEP